MTIYKNGIPYWFGQEDDDVFIVLQWSQVVYHFTHR